MVASRDPSGRLSSLVPAAVGLGILISPTLTGTLIEQQGTGTTTLVLMAFVAASLAIYFPLAFRTPRWSR